MTISFIAGATYSFTTTHGYDEQYVRAWIDFNNDGTFTNDTSERVASVSGEYYLEITQGIISIPSSVLAGTYRMRIATRYGTYPTPCVNSDGFAYGEAHDYTVNITVPTCVTPTTLSVSNTTATAATLNWVSTGTNFDVELVTSGTAPTGTPTYTGVNAPFTTTTPLSASTAYQFYVRANCMADGLSDWAGPFSFSTLCAPQIAPIVPESFTNYGTDAPTPLCWSEAKGAVTANSELTGSTSKWNCGNFANTCSDKGARVNLYGNQTGDWLISPQIDLATTSGVYRVKYDMAVTNYYGTTLQSTLGTHIVRLIISTDGGETWSVDNSLTTYTGAGNYSNTGQTEVINLTDYSGIVKFAFVATTSSTSPDLYFFIDNFVIEEIPSCLEPADLTATDVTATGATLSWVSDGSLFDIEIVESGEEPTGMPTYEGVTNNFTTTTPLTGSTTYNYWVREDCGNDDLSIWAGPFAFATLCGVADVPYVMPINATTGTDLP